MAKCGPRLGRTGMVQTVRAFRVPFLSSHGIEEPTALRRYGSRLRTLLPDFRTLKFIGTFRTERLEFSQ